MYWGWGSDLWAVGRNATVGGFGGSLIRSSATFAFRNHSIETWLGINNTLPQPLDAGLTLVRAALGPFGSTDMYHLACPTNLLHLVRRFLNEDSAILQRSADAQAPIPTTSSFLYPAPTVWVREYSKTRGGNILCPVVPGGMRLAAGLLTWVTATSTCGTYMWETFATTRRAMILAVVAYGGLDRCVDGPCAPLFCNDISQPPKMCLDNFQFVYDWVGRHVPNATRVNLHNAFQSIKGSLLQLDIQVAQYGQRNDTAPVELLRSTLFDPGDPSFEPIAWHIVYDWATGSREIVSLRGDAGAMNVVSNHVSYSQAQPNPSEISTNVAFYCKLCLQYTTVVIFAITIVTILFAIASKGHIEGLNMVEVNRVAGIVWVGRPLLGLRSLVAICLLATASTNLEISGTFTRFEKTSNSAWIATLLSGSEACWLVVVITDIGMVVTKDLTNKYSLYSSVAVAVLATLLSVVNPVQPTFLLNRTCGSPQVNFQVECTAGVVQIGSLRRVIELVVMTSGIVVMCYLWERWRQPHFKLPQHNTSLLLPAGAVYLYYKGPWIFNGTLYLDKASAFMCGLIAVSYKRSIYVLDVKTWRVHVIAVDDGFNPRHLSMESYHQVSIAAAVPLID